MAVIEGGTIVPDGSSPGTKTRRYAISGAPSDGTSGTLAGTCDAGEFVQDVDTGNLYENQNTLASPTYVRIDTV